MISGRAKYLWKVLTIKDFQVFDQIPSNYFICNSVIQAKGIACLSKVWAIGDGKNVDFWDDAWIGRAPLNKKASQMLIQNCKEKIGAKVADYSKDQCIISKKRVSYCY
ncbi:hypothetical protein SUGI_1078120 [Cryptomeria japonica]|nr:hypothetical protein SUGI_1078120 [Cryptomeria japonica]